MPAADAIAECLFRRFPLTKTDWQLVIRTALATDQRLATTVRELLRFLDGRGEQILPKASQVFAALELTRLSEVAVVILGQDPYPTPGDAHGLAFSVQRSSDLPRSLRNLCQEVARDTGRPQPAGDLSAWARQGVLLLNAVLTLDHVTDPHLEQSHHGKGWEALTQALLQAVVSRGQPCVILCWGKKAAATLSALDIRSAQIHRLFATHPSPLSFRRSVPGFPAFQGCGHFSAANAFLRAHGRAPIDWSATAQ